MSAKNAPQQRVSVASVAISALNPPFTPKKWLGINGYALEQSVLSYLCDFILWYFLSFLVASIPLKVETLMLSRSLNNATFQHRKL